MRVFLMASGSYGDVYPFLAIGRELQSRGHVVRLLASPVFRSVTETAGLELIPIGTVETYEAVIQHPDTMHSTRGARLVARTILDQLPESYRLLDDAVGSRVEETVLVGSSLAFTTRLIQEKRGVPAVTVHLAPTMFRSAYRAPRMGASKIPDWFPPPLKRAAWWLADALVADPIFCPGLNRFRERLGLAPVKRLFHEWIHDADGLIGLFPDWFAPPQPDWPAHLHVTGFPLYDQSEDGFHDDVVRFMEAGAAPVVFTAGTASAFETRFFEESVEACRVSGRRGILLTRYPAQVPKKLPDTVRHFDYVPFSSLLPHVAALVHHGGIGTASQAMASGVPQLVRPLAYDQFDNAARLVELGLGRLLDNEQYRGDGVAALLEELTGSPAVRESCRLIATRLAGHDAVPPTCDIILQTTPRLWGRRDLKGTSQHSWRG